MERDAKIICTLGPASASAEVLTKMAQAGMNIVRLNFSHGNHIQHKEKIDLVHEINRKYGMDIKILQDLEGYRIRLGYFKESKELANGDIIYFSRKLGDQDPQQISFDYDGPINAIPIDSDIFIDDGKIHLKVIGHEKDRIKLETIFGGTLKQRKGINIPDLQFQSDILTIKDKLDLIFGIQNKVDYIAQSFVRNGDDIKRVVDVVRPKLPNCKVISKIENKEGVKNVDAIIDECDGIMVARGDLGVSLPIYKIPLIQKYLINRANCKKKMVVTATQMLESMTDLNRPTRAEVSDVANAILDRTDCVMLSGETAVGKFPVECVEMMRQIIEYTERSISLEGLI